MEVKRIKASFYCSESGAEPVREWLMELDVHDRKTIGYAIKLVEYGYPVGMPLTKHLGNGLEEVRISLPSDKIARVIFIAEEGEMILLHGFIKKTQKTPDKELNLAIQRYKKIKQ